MNVQVFSTWSARSGSHCQRAERQVAAIRIRESVGISGEPWNPRHVPLSDCIRKLLQMREPGDSPWVFPSKRARCGHLTALAKQWTASVEGVNLATAERKPPPIAPYCKLYCAHHTFATDMLTEGMSVAEVKDWWRSKS